MGDAWLFFGCRRPDHDYLYASEWAEQARAGTLTCFRAAFSRVPHQPKVYVQHQIREAGPELAQLLLLPNTHVYIAGAANQMPKDVRKALEHCVREHGGPEASRADVLIEQLESSKRLQCETW